MAHAMGESLGIAGLPLAILEHPLSNTPPEQVRTKALAVLGDVIDALTTPAEALAENFRGRDYPLPRGVCPLLPAPRGEATPPSPAPGELEFELPADFDRANELLYAWGWTDGLPVVPPTSERVDRFISDAGLDPCRTVGVMPPRRGIATVRTIAANAVMAGCRPEYLPVVIAIVEALLDPAYALEGRQTTTHAGAPMVIVNGPIAERLGINYGPGCLGPGWRANATIGRAVRLALINIGGASPGVIDSATHGHPGKYTYCFAENERSNPWIPLHVERGFSADTSTVTVVNAEAPHSINDAKSKVALDLMLTIASVMSTLGANNTYYQGHPVLILGPEHAALLHRLGWDKADVKAYIYEHARQPARLVRGRGMEIGREFPHWVDLAHDAAMVPIIARPDDLIVVVAGGAGAKSMCAPTAGRQSLSITRAIQGAL